MLKGLHFVCSSLVCLQLCCRADKALLVFALCGLFDSARQTIKFLKTFPSGDTARIVNLKIGLVNYGLEYLSIVSCLENTQNRLPYSALYDMK